MTHLIPSVQIEVSQYSTTGQQGYLLLTGEQTPLYRNSFTATWFLFDLNSKQLTPLAGGTTSLEFRLVVGPVRLDLSVMISADMT